MTVVDPFLLFPASVETASLIQMRAAGLGNLTLATGLRVIVKRRTETNQPGEYGERTADWSIHVHPSSLPESTLTNPDILIDYCIELADGRRYLVVDASQGYDFTTGSLIFLLLACRPYGKDSL